MTDSAIYDSDIDLSSHADGDSSDEETLDGAESPAQSGSTLRERVDHGSQQTQTASQAAKAIEAAEERTLDAPTAGASRSPYASSTRRTAWDDEMPVLDAGPAPPDYFAATASRRSPPHAAVDVPTATLPARQEQQHREEPSGEHAVTLPPGPGSRHDPVNEELNAQEIHRAEEAQDNRSVDEAQGNRWADEAGGNYRTDALEEAALNETMPLLSRLTPNGKGVKQHKKGRVCRCTRRRCCLSSALFVAVFMFVAILTLWTQHKKPIEIRKHASVHGDPALDHPRMGSCVFDSYSSYVDIPFEDPTRFSLIEWIDLSDEPNFKSTTLMGNVEVIYMHPDSPVVQQAPIVVRLHAATMLPWTIEIRENTTHYKHGDFILLTSLILGTPRRAHALPETKDVWRPPPCLDVFILIYVQEGTVIESWDMSTTHLNFVDHESALQESKGTSVTGVANKASLWIQNRTSIDCAHGKIELSHWASNDTRLETKDGTIGGTYQLHRHMELSSSAGNIDVTIDPVEGEKNSPALPLDDMPLMRELATSTVSGQTKVHIRSPSVHRNSSRLTGDSSAQRQAAELYELEDIWSLEGLRSVHTSDSGSISLHYPSEWRGIFVGYTTFGDISISGDHVVILSDETYRGLRTVSAAHCCGDGVLISDTWSGRSTVFIGDDDE